MPMIDIKNVSKASLQELIDGKVFENKELEYKGYSLTGGKLTEKQKDKFIKEIAAFANTIGGIIIIGMQEDDNRLPVHLSGAGLSLKDYDNWLSSFRQMVLSRIRPHLHGIECVPVELEEDSIAIVISVPKSYARPHSFWDGNKDEFFIRYANGITNMDIDDLRKEFVYSSVLQDKIRQFRKDRISLILANECVGDLGNDGKIVFHIVPEWSFELGNTVDFNKLYRHRGFHPLSGSIWSYSFNADGYCIYGSDSETKKINTYTQVMHNGIIEATEIRLMSRYKEVSGSKKNQVYDWDQTQGAFIRKLCEYGTLLEECGVPKPWHVSATLLNLKGYVAMYGWGEESSPVDRNIVNSLDGICTEDVPLKDALKPVFNSLSNAFGFMQSSCFNDNN